MTLGEACECAAAVGRQEKTSASDPLSPREREVVALVAQGLTNLAIAHQLVLSERTVESHVRNALGKVGVSSRVALATWALQGQSILQSN